MIKTTIRLASIVLLGIQLIACSPNQFDPEAAEQEVLQAFASLVEASKSMDFQQYIDHFDTKSFVGLNSDGSNWNSLEELIQTVEPGFAAVATVESLHFTNVEVEVIDANTAILVNEFEQSMVLQSGVAISIAGGGTQVWSKRSGTWKLVSVSASMKPNK